MIGPGYRAETTEQLYAEAERLLAASKKDIASATASLREQKRFYEKTRRPILRVIWPDE